MYFLRSFQFHFEFLKFILRFWNLHVFYYNIHTRHEYYVRLIHVCKTCTVCIYACMYYVRHVLFYSCMIDPNTYFTRLYACIITQQRYTAHVAMQYYINGCYYIICSDSCSPTIQNSWILWNYEPSFILFVMIILSKNGRHLILKK